MNNLINTKEKSKIILLCLGLNIKNKKIQDLHLKDIYKIFQIFGKILKIIIFSKKKILKAFLEFDNFEITQEIKNFFHENFIDDFGKARIFFSDLKELNFSNKFLEYKDFTKKKNFEECSTELNSPVSLKKIEKENFNIFSKSNMEQFFCKLNSNLPSKKKKTAKELPGKNFNFEKIKLLGKIPKFQKMVNLGKSPQFHKIFLLEQNKKLLSSQKKLEIAEMDFSQNISEFEKIQLLEKTKISEMEKIILKKKLEIPSRVILISELSPFFKKGNQIFNLFKNFGKIKTIIFMSNLHKVLIEFTEFEFSTFCVNKINNFIIFGFPLKIQYSKYQEIDLKKTKSSVAQSLNEILIFDLNKMNKEKKKFEKQFFDLKINKNFDKNLLSEDKDYFSNKNNLKKDIDQSLKLNHFEKKTNHKIKKKLETIFDKKIEDYYFQENKNFEKKNNNNYNEQNEEEMEIINLPSKIILVKIIHLKNLKANNLYSKFFNFEGLHKIEIISKNKKFSFFKLIFENLDFSLKFLIESEIEFKKNDFKFNLSFGK